MQRRLSTDNSIVAAKVENDMGKDVTCWEFFSQCWRGLHFTQDACNIGDGDVSKLCEYLHES